MNKILSISLFLCIFLTACSQKSTTHVVAHSQPIPIVHPTKPRPVIIREVNVKVLEKSQVEEKIKQSEATGERFAIMTISPDSFENLGLNLADIIRYIQQSQAIIEYYRRIEMTISEDSNND